MSEREELAEDIRSLGITVIDGPPVDLSEPLAQHLHNLGYRKPRVIAAHEELDELPVGSVVMDYLGNPFLKKTKLTWRRHNRAFDYEAHDFNLPATVLFEATA